MVVAKNKHLTENYFFSSFISGLKEPIKNVVKMFRPQVLTDVVYLAKQEVVRTQKLLGGG